MNSRAGTLRAAACYYTIPSMKLGPLPQFVLLFNADTYPILTQGFDSVFQHHFAVRCWLELYVFEDYRTPKCSIYPLS